MSTRKISDDNWRLKIEICLIWIRILFPFFIFKVHFCFIWFITRWLLLPLSLSLPIVEYKISSRIYFVPLKLQSAHSLFWLVFISINMRPFYYKTNLYNLFIFLIDYFNVIKNYHFKIVKYLTIKVISNYFKILNIH